MDATTKTKTFAVALVGLLVGSVFVVGSASAHTADFTAGAAPAVADPSTIPHLSSQTAVAHYDETGAQAQLVWPSAGVTYNATYDFTLTAVSSVPTPAAGGFFLMSDSAFTGASAGTLVTAANGSTVQATNDCEHAVTGPGCTTPTLSNITFPGQRFDSAGVWDVAYMNALSNPMTTGDFSVLDQFFVNNTNTMNLSSSQYSWVYSPSASFGYTLTVTNESGNTVQGAAVTASPAATGLPNGGLTNANGQIGVLVSGTPGAGTYMLTASKDVTGDGTADVNGTANFTIVAAPLNIAGNTTTALTGFQNNVTFTPSLPDSNASFAFTGSALGSGNAINVTITSPNGTAIYVNTTRGSSTGFVDFLNAGNSGIIGCFDPNNQAYLGTDAALGDCSGAAVLASAFGIDYSTGQVFFAPGSLLWGSGTYTATITVNTVGAASTMPEYSGSFGINAGAPASVNLALTDVSGNTLTSIPVKPFSGNSLQAQTVKLKITGSTLNEHPTCETGGPSACVASPAGDETTFLDNVTITGPVLTGTAFNTLSYVNSTGILTIDNLVPTGAGNITFSVTWKGTTTSVTVPTTNGAMISLNQSAVLVGTEQNVTASVHDSAGFYISTATIDAIYENGATGTALSGANMPINPFPQSGNSTADNGQGGNYKLDLEPSITNNLIVQAKVLAPGAPANTASYALIRLLVNPNHDLIVTLNKNETSAGLPTAVWINATNSTNNGFDFATSGKGVVYLLTAQEKTDLLANGTTDLPTTSGLGVRFFKTGGSGAFAAFTNATTTGNANFTAALGSGTYYVYVQDAPGTSLKHDNLNNMPTFVVHNYTATFDPATIPVNWVGQTNVTVNVTIKDWMGNLLVNNSAIKYSSLNSTGGVMNPTSGDRSDQSAINVTGINSGFKSLTLTGGTVGAVMIEVQPAGTGGIYTGADGMLTIAGPTVVVQPPSVSILSPTILTISVTNLTGGAIANAEVRVCGLSLNANFPATPPTSLNDASRANCTALDVTNADGTAAVSVSPNALSALTVYVNNQTTGVTVPVFAGTLVLSVDKTAPAVGDTVTITASQASGAAGSAGISVNVTRDGTHVVTQSTDAAGHVVLSNVSAGNYSLVATRSGFMPGFLNFSVTATGGNVTPPGPHFKLSNLTVPDSATVGQPVTVSVDVTNDGGATGTANMLLLVNDKIVATFSLPDLGPGETQSVQFQQFTPTVAGTYHIVVKIGTQTVDKTITVNGQTTTTTTSTTETSPTSTTTTSTTVSSPTTTTSTSPTGTTTTTTTSPTSTTPAPSPKVPGFEFVVLVGALAAALLVLRRKN